MSSKIIEFTRKEYDLIAKNRGIKEPQNMSTEELLDTLSRYDSRRKVKSNRRKLLKMKLEKLLKYRIFQKMIYVGLKSYKINQQMNYEVLLD